MKKNYTTLLITVLFFAITNAQTPFTQWSFENSKAPTSGSGNFSLIGGTNAASTEYATGHSGKAYSITNFPGDTSNSGTSGYRFNIDTSGYNNITVSFYVSGTNQSSRWQQYEYSTNGGANWTILGNNNGGLTTSFTQKTYAFPASCDNNPNFVFRIVSIFGQPTNTAYESIQGGGYNGNNGKWLIDDVNFSFNTLSNEQNGIAGLKIYPSPAKSYLNINTESFTEKEFILYDILGKIALKAKITNQSIDISSLKKGIYIAKITEGGKTSSRKIIIE